MSFPPRTHGLLVETTPLTRRVGAIHLGLAGALNVASGALLAYVATTGRLLDAALWQAGEYMTQASLLSNASTIAFLATDVALFVGVVAMLVGIGTVVGGWWVATHRHWKRAVAMAGVGALNPLVLPVALIGIACTVASRRQFENATTQ